MMFLRHDREINLAEFRVAPVKPASRESLWATIDSHHGILLADGISPDDENIKRMMDGGLEQALLHSQWFDFGRVPITSMVIASNDAEAFRKASLVVMPYPSVIFRVREMVTRAELLVLLGSRSDELGETRVVPLNRGEWHETEFVVVVKQLEDRSLHVLPLTVSGVDGRLVRIENGLVISDFLGTLNVRSIVEDKPSVTAFTDMVYGLWLILNTKHIRTTVETPDAKLNAARVKRGKHPLQRVTRIDAQQYVTALQATREYENSEGGTSGDRKRPKMHLRRAHLRHLGSRVIPIHAMIINGRDGLVAPVRDKYAVDKIAPQAVVNTT